MALSNVVLILVCLITCSVGAQVCTKLATIDGSPADGGQVFSNGVYHVKTTLASDSAEIRKLATNLLKNISTVEFKRKSFIGTLQPKHIKQVSHSCYICRICMNNIGTFQLCKDQRIKFIRQLERNQNKIVCDRLYKGQNDSAIPDSYIVIAKDERESTVSVSDLSVT